MKTTHQLLFAISLVSLLALGTAVAARNFRSWGEPINAELIPGTSVNLNTSFNDGCPSQAPDGLSLFIASNRTGGLGGQDIWVATRASVDTPWGDPIHLPSPVNSDRDDFCPTPVRGHGLFFVSRRYIPDVSCGTNNGPATDTDIYFTRYEVRKGSVDWANPGTWAQPQNVGCQVNSPFDEWSPSFFESDDGQAYLYFASTRPGGPGPTNDADIYFSVDFGPAQFAPGLNTEFNDHRPNVRRDGREIVFDSDRPGNLGPAGTFDIWSATRSDILGSWDTAVHLPFPINTAGNETRASLSWDGTTMYFGSNRPTGSPGGGSEGAADVYVVTRSRRKGGE